MLYTQKNTWLNLFGLVLPQILIFGFSLWLAILWRYPNGLSEREFIAHIQLFSLISCIWLVLYYSFGLLDLKTHKRFPSLFSSLVGASLLGLLAAVVIFYAQPSFIITPRRFLLLDIALVFTFSLLWQILIRRLMHTISKQTVYLIDLASEFNSNKNEFAESIDWMTIHSLSHTDLLALTEKTHRQHQFSLFVVPSSPSFSTETLELFAHLHSHGATFVRWNDFYEEVFRRVYTTNLNNWWLLEHTQTESFGFYPLIKRVLDVVFAILIGFIFIFTLPIIFILIKLFDRGPIFFKQTRLSINGTPFTIYKYRTMKSGTANNTWTADHDPRVTAVGRFLRTTRLDELPQWINILRGDMSLIGPRPEQAGIVEQLKDEVPYFESRHAIRPGLIGWAQLHVYAGTVSESKQKLQYDLYYLKHRSFLFDLEILLKTISHIFFLQGK